MQDCSSWSNHSDVNFAFMGPSVYWLACSRFLHLGNFVIYKKKSFGVKRLNLYMRVSIISGKFAVPPTLR